MEQYYGPLKVSTVVDEGDNFVNVTFQDGTHSIMNKEYFEETVSDKKVKDWNTHQENKLNKIYNEFLVIVSYYDIKHFEIEGLLLSIKQKINDRIGLAENYKWFNDSKNFGEGMDPRSFFSVSEAEKIIKDYEKENNNGTSSVGDGINNNDKK